MWKPLARRETRYLRPRVLLSLAFVIGVVGAGTVGYAAGDRLLALGTTDQLERLERPIAKGQARP